MSELVRGVLCHVHKHVVEDQYQCREGEEQVKERLVYVYAGRDPKVAGTEEELVQGRDVVASYGAVDTCEVCMYVCMYVCMCVCVCVYMIASPRMALSTPVMYVCVYVCMYLV